MQKVLFVCGDNLGRSQVAEALFNRRAKGSSAGSCAGKPEIKEKRKLREVPFEAVKEVIEIMKSDYGIDMSNNISKPFSTEMVRRADKVVTLCAENECPNIAGAEHWDIPKFSQLDREEKRNAIRMLAEKVEALLKQMGE
jgi:arsenate reductase